MTFALDLQRFAEKAKDKADEAVGAIVVNIAAEIDRRSPVGDGLYWKSPPPPGYRGGHFRGNWQLGVDQRLTAEFPGIDPDGAQTQARIVAAIPDEASGRVYNLSNNAPYSMRLEMGWSRQAPAGVVGLTVTMFDQIVREAVEGAQ